MFFFFNDTATTEIYTLSLHDALPISDECARGNHFPALQRDPRAVEVLDGGAEPDFHVFLAPQDLGRGVAQAIGHRDRKSTRLNSSHSQISYAVFCLKKKTNRHACPVI